MSLIAVPSKIFPAASSDALLPVKLFGLSNITLAIATGVTNNILIEVHHTLPFATRSNPQRQLTNRPVNHPHIPPVQALHTGKVRDPYPSSCMACWPFTTQPLPYWAYTTLSPCQKPKRSLPCFMWCVQLSLSVNGVQFAVAGTLRPVHV